MPIAWVVSLGSKLRVAIGVWLGDTEAAADGDATDEELRRLAASQPEKLDRLLYDSKDLGPYRPPQDKEIAARLGLSPSTVSRLKKQIRTDIGEYLRQRWFTTKQELREQAMGEGKPSEPDEEVGKGSVRQSVKGKAMHPDELHSHRGGWTGTGGAHEIFTESEARNLVCDALDKALELRLRRCPAVPSEEKPWESFLAGLAATYPRWRKWPSVADEGTDVASAQTSQVPPAGQESTESVAGENAIWLRIRSAIRTLTWREQIAVLLASVATHTGRQLAFILGTTTTAYRSALYRAHRRLSPLGVFCDDPARERRSAWQLSP